MYIMFFLLVFISNSYAEDIDYIDIKKGQHAPFSGKLLTNEALAKILSTQEYKIKDLELDLKYQYNTKMLENKLKYSLDIAKLESENSYLKEINNTRYEQIKKYKNMNRYNKLYMYGSFLLGSVTSIAIFYSVKQ
jgi:Leucine-rich repeat (LRR) protein